MIHAYLSHPGTDHIHLGRANEDRIRVLSRDGLTAAAVCDGAGSFGAGAEAAELVSDALTALLHEEFDRLFSLSADKVRAHLARAVEDVLRVHSRRSGIREQDLACTILAAAAHEDGRCLCLHLGDGIILQQNEGDACPSVVSCPMTGLMPHSTYLTMNCDLNHYLRMYRWKSAALSRLLLLSDGAAEHLVQLRGGAGWVYTAGKPDMQTIRTRLHAANPRDDHSALLISRLQP